MSSRAQRIARIVKLRDNELKQTVVRLQAASRKEAQCRIEHQQAEVACERAVQARRNLTHKNVDVLTYLEAQDWILSVQARLSHTAQHLHHASVELKRSQALTHQARTKVKQLEHLQDQLLVRARRAEALADRALDDEISQRIFRNKH